MPTNRDRRDALRALLHFRGPLSDLRRDLARFGWDSDQELATLSRESVASVLDRFLAGELTAAEVEDWADAVESRDDIGFEAGFEPLLDDLVFTLANPLLTEPLSRDRALRWMQRLATTPLPIAVG
jgi:hypothetical protein